MAILMRSNGEIIAQDDGKDIRQLVTENKNDLEGADLSDMDLHGLDLSGADLEGASMKHTNLAGADMSFADLRNSDLRYVDLTGCDLYEANLSGSDLWSANMRGSEYCGAYLSDVNLGNADLRDTDLSGVDLDGSILIGTRVSNDTSFDDAALEGAVMYVVNEDDDPHVRCTDAYLEGTRIDMMNALLDIQGRLKAMYGDQLNSRIHGYEVMTVSNRRTGGVMLLRPDTDKPVILTGGMYDSIESAADPGTPPDEERQWNLLEDQGLDETSRDIGRTVDEWTPADPAPVPDTTGPAVSTAGI